MMQAQSADPTAPYPLRERNTRKSAALVRRAIDGKPRFSYDPSTMPIALFDMLTPAEQRVIEDFRNEFVTPPGVNVSDPRDLLPGSIHHPRQRQLLESLREHFPISDDLPGE